MLAKYAKPEGCSGCSLESLGVGFAPAVGPAHARLRFVGESLGYNEAMQGEPFIGAAGAMLDRVFRRAEIARDHVRIANCVSCRPPGDYLDGAPWEHSALTQCAQYLESDLAVPGAVCVVTLGGIALKQVLGLWGVDGVRLQDFHGTVHRDPLDRFWVVPTFHPSHLQRGAVNLLDVVRHDVGVAQSIARAGNFSRRPVSLLLDPPVAQFQAWESHFAARYRADPEGTFLDVDIETPDTADRDEGELTVEDQSTQILRVNFGASYDESVGVTVPYVGPYISIISRLIESGVTLRMWNKDYDEPRLRLAGHHKMGEIWDLMWLAHHVQSDWPLGLGFWGPVYSDYGAWKHLSKQKGKEAEYAAVDGLQTCRVGNGLIRDAIKEGLWDAFYRHTHLREQYVLRPAHESGCPISVPKLDAFHEKLQTVATEKLNSINESNLVGTFYPKAGYAKRPKGGPPKGISGEKYKKKGDEAKAGYIDQAIELVERTVPVTARDCQSCGKTAVPASHNCLRPRKSRVRTKPDESAPDGDAALIDRTVEGPRSTLIERQAEEPRWFWKLPFNPDASQQILKFIKDSGEEPGRQKKTKKETGDKATLKKLHAKTKNPVYKYLLDYKAVKKVDSTYVVGSKKRIWADGRIHPEITFRPSMFRDSCINPNIQNVVADKEGKASLAAGFRHCIVADTGYRIIEIDYGGIEGIDTGWMSGDPDYIRLATLGVHAYLTSFKLAEAGKIGSPASLSWSDADLALFFKDIKNRFPFEYDMCKRCVHGNNYGLTVYGMHQTFPELYATLKAAEEIQDLYYSICPKLPGFHSRMRDYAYEHETLGGSYVDDYTLLTQGGHHPFGYRHKFFGVQTYKPLNESEFRKLQYIARKRMHREMHPSVRIINRRPFQVAFGEDSKRVIAFFPQSIAAGTLKEAELTLFHPDSPCYIGDIAEGKTPLIAPIHDSLLMHVPDHLHEWVIALAVEVMRRPIPTMPCPPEWGIGSHIRVNVDVKVSPVGGSWADVKSISIPDMAPATAMENTYMPTEDQEWDDFQDLGTTIQ